MSATKGKSVHVRRKSGRILLWLRKGGLVSVLLTATLVPVQAKETRDAGKPIFEENCTPCHGDDGTGKTPPGMALGAHDLTSAEVSKKPDSELARTISQGRNKMPAFGDKLDEKQIRELLIYVRTLRKR
jgi:mono/diheme cytochrome c family protein